MPLLQPASRSLKWQARNARGVASIASIEAGEAKDTADDAHDVATAASTTAGAAVDATEAISAFQRVRDSYSDPGSVTAADAGADASITIGAHNRYYLDAPTDPVALSAGVLTGLAFGTTYFISYLDPDFAGGAVTYEASLAVEDAMNTIGVPARHFVDSITTPADGDPPSDGGGGYGVPPWRNGAIP